MPTMEEKRFQSYVNVKTAIEAILDTPDGKILEKFLESFTGYSTPNLGVNNSDILEGGRRVTCFIKWINDIDPKDLQEQLNEVSKLGGWFG